MSANLRGEAPRIVRFCVVGLGNTSVTLAAFAVFLGLGLPGPMASAIAFCAGAVNSFLLNRRWTFAGLATPRLALLRFAGLQGIGASASALGVFVLERRGLGHLAAECVILPFVTAALYSVSRLLVFRSAAI